MPVATKEIASVTLDVPHRTVRPAITKPARNWRTTLGDAVFWLGFGLAACEPQAAILLWSGGVASDHDLALDRSTQSAPS